MKNEEVNLRVINEAPLAKRIFAAIIDFLMAIFLWLFLSMLVMTPIANTALGYSDKTQLGYTYQIASHLFVYQQLDDNNEPQIIEVKDFSEKLNGNKQSQILTLYQSTNLEPAYYLEHLRYYYLSFLTGIDVEMPNNTSKHTYDMVKDHFVSPDYLDNVKGTLMLPKDFYTEKWFNQEIIKIGGEGDAYFETINIHLPVSIKDGVDKEKANEYLKNCLNNATADMYYRSYYQNINNSLKGIQIFITIPPYLLVMLIVYLIIPLITRDGESIGKKFCHIALCNLKGYRVQKRQIVFRFFIFFVLMTLSLFVVGIGLTSFATLGIGALLMFIVVLVNKKHKAIHDFAAMTLVIDAKTSVWFASQEDELKRSKELEEKLNRYKSNNIGNKNIIQIGDKIIEENIKEETK